MNQSPTPITEPDQNAANILLQTPSITAKTDQTCPKLYTAWNGSLERCLWITYTRSPDEVLAEWRNHDSETLPERMGVIAIGDQMRTTGVSDNSIPPGSAAPVVKTVANPTDLTGLSSKVSEFCKTWGTADRRFNICFDSLTPLLVYVSVDRAYRFVNTLISQVEAFGATGYYHLTPTVHDAETVKKLAGLFDDVVDLSKKGGSH